jgi:hypothetical protein
MLTQAEIRANRATLERRGLIAMDSRVFGAADAQQQLTGTAPNAGIPAKLTTFLDRNALRVIFSPMKIAQILGDERKVGDWVTDTSMFPVIETTGAVTAYDDYSANGSAGFNTDFPQRQSMHVQTVIDYGERETDRAALAGINTPEEKKNGALLAINKWRNRSYAFGIANLQNYGILNDPGLPASIQPGPKAYNTQAHGPWITNGVMTATPNEVYADVQALYYQLVKQAGGVVELSKDVPLVLAMDPNTEVALTSANSFGVVAIDLIKRTFPNIRIETAVEYAGTAGNLVQLIATNVDGQQTGWPAFTEKLRTHRMVVDLSSFRMKLSAGTWGSINRQLWAYASMLGV